MRHIIHCIILLIFVGLPLRANASEFDEGFSNETAAGILAATGNSDLSTLELRQTNFYRWPMNSLKFQAAYLRGSSHDVLALKTWGIGLRFDPQWSDTTGVFVGQELMANVFRGYRQQYNSDLGLRQVLHRSEWMTWAAEGGYRYTVQNRLFGDQAKSNYLRFYSEALFPWSWRTNASLWAEYLPNLTRSSNWQANAGTSITALLTEILSLRFSYQLRFRNVVLPGARQNLDSILITSLVVKW